MLMHDHSQGLKEAIFARLQNCFLTHKLLRDLFYFLLWKLSNIFCFLLNLWIWGKNQKRNKQQSIQPQSVRAQKRLLSSCMKIQRNGKRLKRQLCHEVNINRESMRLLVSNNLNITSKKWHSKFDDEAKLAKRLCQAWNDNNSNYDVCK